jgi:caspase domain-containing protein
MEGKRSALILASYDYEDPGLRMLRAPARDAEALARVLQDPEIGNFEVRTVLNQPAHAVNLAVEEFFADRKPDDLLVLHFSGHGVKDDSGELYFATADTRLLRLESTTVSAAFVNRQMSRSRSRRVVLLLDCCYAGAFERGMVPKADKAVHLEEQFGGRGRAVITASGAMEFAFENAELTASSELRPSVFTRAVVEGLETGDADRDQDGYVDLDELYDYVYDRVRDVTPNQTPGKWTFAIQGELFIARRRTAVAKPAPLPAGLQQALDQPLGGIRLGAVHELERLLGGPHAGLALAARLTLERLRDDDSRAVAAAAATALAAHTGPPAPTVAEAPAPPPAPPPAPKLELSASVVDFGRLPWHAESPRRTLRLGNAGGGTLDARAATSASWLRLHRVGDELAITVDTTVAGDHEGVIEVTSAGGSASIPVLLHVDPEPRVAPPPVERPPVAQPRVAQPPPVARASAERAAAREPALRSAETSAAARPPGRGRSALGHRRQLGLLLAAVLGVSAIAVWVSRDPGQTAAPSATTVISAAATTQAKPPTTTRFAVDGGSLVGTRFFEDPFSTTSGGWDTLDDATHTKRYRGGAYEITAKQGGDYIGVPHAHEELSSLRNVVVRVDARRVSADDPNGRDPNGYGIACRQKDTRNYYWFNITNVGYYSLNKRLNGEQVRLQGPRPTTGIIKATSPNHIQVMCAQAKEGGTRLVLWVNGRQLLDKRDGDRALGPGGDIGVYGHNAGMGPSRWAFDNFSVWKV